MQKRAVKILTSLKSKYSITKAFYDTGILKLKELHIYSVCLFVYKFIHRKLPVSLSHFFIKNEECHERVTRGKKCFRVPLYKKAKSDLFIKKAGLKIWEEMEKHVKHDIKIGVFKKDVKNYLLNDYLVYYKAK